MNSAYFEQALAVLQRIQATQASQIDSVASTIFNFLKEGGVLHIFGTGHSSAVVQEAFHRAGGLVPVNPMLEPFLTPLVSPRKSGRLERIDEIAPVLLDYYDLRAGESLVVISNSGINPLPVEMAFQAKGRGLTVIAITSLAHSSLVPSRHRSGKKLSEIAHIVIDNCGQPGDGSLSFPGLPEKVGPTSALAGIFIINSLTCAIVQKYLENDLIPPILISANVPGGEEHNRKLEEKYRGRIKLL